MSYDISLHDPVTKEVIQLDYKHQMTGGTYAIGGTTELWLNITWNYAKYYYDATEGDPRFANDDYDGGIRYGIRGIYGKSGAESIPMLLDMIHRIEDKYRQVDGNWISTVRTKARFYDEDGNEIDNPVGAIMHGKKYTKEEYEIEVNEGPNEDYWEPTAGNAIKPLYKLLAMAELRPDGIWNGD